MFVLKRVGRGTGNRGWKRRKMSSCADDGRDSSRKRWGAWPAPCPQGPGVPPFIRTIGHPLFPQGTEGGPPLFRWRLHAKHTSRCWNKGGVVPPRTKCGGGRGPRLRKSWSGGRGCLRSAWVYRSPRPMCEIGRSDRFVSTVGATTSSRLKLQWKRMSENWKKRGRPDRF